MPGRSDRFRRARGAGAAADKDHQIALGDRWLHPRRRQLLRIQLLRIRCSTALYLVRQVRGRIVHQRQPPQAPSPSALEHELNAHARNLNLELPPRCVHPSEDSDTEEPSAPDGVIIDLARADHE